MPAKRPTKADRMRAAGQLRAAAARLRDSAQKNRLRSLADKQSGIPELFARDAAKFETKASQFERVANWMVSDGQ